VRDTWLLARRAIREVWRQPEATIPILLIPAFFLYVNVGQASKTFPSTTPFLHHQPYVAFQLPVSIIFAVSTITSGLAMVTDIDVGYLDKLRTAPIRRSALVWGRLASDLVRALGAALIIIATSFAFGAHIATGVPGFLALVLLATSWGVAIAGFGMAIALFTRSVAATNSAFIAFFPILFLTPNFVPSELLSEPFRTMASLNPVTSLLQGMRDLVLLPDWQWLSLTKAFGVVVVTFLVTTGASLAALRRLGD
jgi:ABC-2 type transport system permease protein